MVVLAQDTPERVLVSALGFGLAMIVQLVPFQCATSVLVDVLVVNSPTAKQFVVVGQDTPERPSLLGLEFGLAMIVQLVPFQRSTNVWVKLVAT
jgi:hypothetical protein